MPPDVDSLDALVLEEGALGIGFSSSPPGLDSLWAHLSGAGEITLSDSAGQSTFRGDGEAKAESGRFELECVEAVELLWELPVTGPEIFHCAQGLAQRYGSDRPDVP